MHRLMGFWFVPRRQETIHYMTEHVRWPCLAVPISLEILSITLHARYEKRNRSRSSAGNWSQAVVARIHRESSPYRKLIAATVIWECPVEICRLISKYAVG